MKKFVKSLLFTLIAAAIVAAAAAGLYAMSKRHKPPEREGRPPIPVRITPVGRADLTGVITLNGNIEPLLDVEIRPKLAGRLARLALDDGTPVEEGLAVQAGALLAVLEHADLDALLAQAEAARLTARAGVTAAETAVADTGRERRRAENLFAQGSVTEQARDRAVTADEQAAAAREQARARETQARAAVQAAQVAREEAFLRAPFDGVITAKHADPGALVSPSTPLVRLMHLETVKIRAPIPTRYLPALTANPPRAEIAVDVWPDRVFPGDLHAIHPAVAENIRSAILEFRAPNRREGADVALKPGLYASVRIPLENREQVLAVPVDAVIRILDRQVVFLADGNIARARDVQTGLRDGALVEILDGLAEGDALVVAGQHRLTDGTAIRLDAAPAEEEPK